MAPSSRTGYGKIACDFQGMERASPSRSVDPSRAPIDAPPVISFVIPVRNDAVRLAHCLVSLRQDACGAPHELIVIDHGSRDGSADVAASHGARVIVSTARNVAELRNHGVLAAQAPLVAFIDADHRVGRGWVAAALDAMADRSVVGAGAPYHAPADGTWVQRAYDGFRSHRGETAPTEWLGAGNLVVRRTAFDAVGGFDTSLESCEDVDLCIRLRAAGRLLSVPAMHSTHYGDPETLTRLFRSELWRGRDNVRVSLRAPWSIRNIVSTALPIVQLALLAALLIGLVLGARGVWLVVAAAVALAGSITLRALVLWRNARQATPVGLGAAWLVAATYDAGRASAMLVRATHHRRPAVPPVEPL